MGIGSEHLTTMMQTKLEIKNIGNGIDDDYVGLYVCACGKFTTSFYLPEMLTPPRDVNIQVTTALARVVI